MYINCNFKLSLVLDAEKFEDVFDKYCCVEARSNDDGSEYLDRSLAEKGIIIRYRASRYKKKIGLAVDAARVTGGAVSNPEKMISKLEKRIEKYFQSEFKLDDFTLSGLTLSTIIDVGSRQNVASYMKVVRRIGRVKGFTPVRFDWLDKDMSFCLRGNSNGIEFLLYDLEQTVADHLRSAGEKGGELIHRYRGILQTEVRLTKLKAIRKYTNSYGTADQIVDLLENCQRIMMENFAKVIPYGDYWKKDAATEIIRREVKDDAVRRRMLRLVALIPEKKSLRLAQKAMSYRHPEQLLVEFAKIGLSPVTLTERQSVKCLKNLYEYL